MKGETTTDYLVTNVSSFTSTVSNINVIWTNTRDTDCKFTKGSISGFDSSIFESSGQAESLVNQNITAEGGTATVNPIRVKSDADVEAIPSGSSFALGNHNVTVYGAYKKKHKTLDMSAPLGTLYYYNGTNIKKAVDSEFKANRDFLSIRQRLGKLTGQLLPLPLSLFTARSRRLTSAITVTTISLQP